MSENNKLKILLIEDDETLVRAYKDHFMRAGYDVGISLDGEDALEKVKIFHPDLILLDILMPKLDGISVLIKLKDDIETKEIPVIMLTNVGGGEKVKEAAQAGAMIYFVKADTSLAYLTGWINGIFFPQKVTYERKF
ncbi:response regulator [Patescibacteria group bacterium]|nr:response regulator [Patescibacteria group bacterium]